MATYPKPASSWHGRAMRLAVILFAPIAVAALSACASQPALDRGVEQISFEPQPAPFCGVCETTSFVVTATGELRIEKGRWRGNYRHWERRRETKRVTAAQYEAFKQTLEPYVRGESGPTTTASCVDYIPDQDGALVRMTGKDGSRLRAFDFGCLDDSAMNDVVRSAPKVLGL